MSIRNGMPAADLPAVTWRKSRRSGPQGGNCVEIAQLTDGQVAVRNSRHPAGPALVFSPDDRPLLPPPNPSPAAPRVGNKRAGSAGPARMLAALRRLEGLADRKVKF